MLALHVIGDLARRVRRHDEGVIGRIDQRKPVGVGAETALVGIASRGVEHYQLGASAPLLHYLEHGLDRHTLVADIAFLPDRRIGRDHVALVAGLHTIASEKQHHDRAGLDPGF